MRLLERENRRIVHKDKIVLTVNSSLRGFLVGAVAEVDKAEDVAFSIVALELAEIYARDSSLIHLMAA